MHQENAMPPYVIGLDTEAHLIRPGTKAPRLVCVSGCSVPENGAWLLLAEDGTNTFRRLLQDPDATITIHNAAFDAAVFCARDPSLLPLVFDAYEQGRIRCTVIREKMLRNAAEGLVDEGQPQDFSLAGCVKRRFGVDLSESKTGQDSWRLRYGELDGKPLDQWPAEAKEYAKDDAVWHLRVFQSQEQERWREVLDPWTEKRKVADVFADERGQTWAAFFLHLMECWGILTEEAAVQKLLTHLEGHVSEAREKLVKLGLMRMETKRERATGLTVVNYVKNSKIVRGLVEEAYASKGEEVPRTPPSDTYPDGQVSIKGEALVASGVEGLRGLAEHDADAKTLSVWGLGLTGQYRDKKKQIHQTGVRTPDGWLLQPRWNSMVATNRTSAFAPPVQQLPRKGDVRPCFVPRKGNWFLSVDYSFVELVTWAQTCLDLLGHSRMADAIRAGIDPHLDLAVEILLRLEGKTVTYEDAKANKNGWAKDPRQKAKAANFGYPGGLGVDSFMEYAWDSYGVAITPSQSAALKAAWRTKWPESVEYAAWFSRRSQEAWGERFQVVLPRTGFVRGGCTYTSGCNTMFQGLAARGAKEAMLPIMRECYAVPSSPLYGCRPVLFVHDEFILEVPAHRERAHLASERLCRLMVDGMQKFTPDVPVGVEPTLMERWYKEASPVWAADGTLELWRPAPKEA